MLKAVSPKPSCVALRNLKKLRDKLVHAKLKLTDEAERGNIPCGRGNCKIYISFIHVLYYFFSFFKVYLLSIFNRLV